MNKEVKLRRREFSTFLLPLCAARPSLASDVNLRLSRSAALEGLAKTGVVCLGLADDLIAVALAKRECRAKFGKRERGRIPRIGFRVPGQVFWGTFCPPNCFPFPGGPAYLLSEYSL